MNQKPLTVAREDYAKEIIECTNTAPLPAFAKIDILNGIIKSLEPVAMQEYQAEKEAWDKAQEEEKPKEE